MKRLLTLFALVLTLVCLNGCSGAKGFKVTSCSLSSITPSGLKSVKAVLDVGITNPMSRINVSGIKGVIKDGDTEFATFEGEGMEIPRKSSGIHRLPCTGTISKGIGLSDLLKLAVQQDFSKMTVDMNVKVRLKCGLGRTIRFKNIKITDLMEPEVAAAYLDIIIKETSI